MFNQHLSLDDLIGSLILNDEDIANDKVDKDKKKRISLSNLLELKVMMKTLL